MVTEVIDMNREENKKWLIDCIEDNKEVFCEASKAIWRNPELAMQEHFAVETLTGLLENSGFRTPLHGALP